MTFRNKFTLTLATLVLGLAMHTTYANAQEGKQNCSPVYGGGETCGAYTPPPTGLEVSALLYTSVGLYTAGITSFVLGHKASDLIPKK